MRGIERIGGCVADAALVTCGLAYVGYPLVALARAAVVPKPYRSGPAKGRVSVVIAAHDEAEVIGTKLDSVAASASAAAIDGEVEVIVADDGSSDSTTAVVEVAAARSSVPVALLRLPRGGKAAALEAAVAAATGDILVFTDANSILDHDALTHLLAPFADPLVGGVAGDQRYVAGSGALGERLHWAFDRRLKQAESACGSTVSATGALYAVRREHFVSVPAHVTDDFYISTGVVADGRRLVFAGQATVTEPAAGSLTHEYARKVRVMTRGLNGVLARRELLAPRHGFYALAFASRKVLRRVAGPASVLAAIGSVLAFRRRLRHRVVAVGSVWVAAVGALGLGFPELARRHRAIGLPSFACAAVAASTHAVLNVARGEQITQWERPPSVPRRSP